MNITTHPMRANVHNKNIDTIKRRISFAKEDINTSFIVNFFKIIKNILYFSIFRNQFFLKICFKNLY